MPSTQPLSDLQVIGIRYRGVQFAENDERALDAYVAAGVYEAAGVPFEVSEPRFPGSEQSQAVSDDPYQAREVDYGLFNGLIAEQVAAARRAGSAILMTGGDCTHITGIVGGFQDVHGTGCTHWSGLA
jgi:arginase